MGATERLRDRRGPIIALSFLVFVGAFIYRFNALLGSLSGFDGDHFIFFLGSTSVARGERPLRDFVDAGLQGAWPALTYELSALAQRLGGESLLSEAILCVGAVALSAALLFRAAASVAGIWASAVVTLLSVATSTRLYGYHKVLVSSVAVALLLRYARAPSIGNLCLMAVWSAAAFSVPARLPGVRGAGHGLSHRFLARPPGGPPCAPGDRLRGAHGSCCSWALSIPFTVSSGWAAI